MRGRVAAILRRRLQSSCGIYISFENVFIEQVSGRTGGDVRNNPPFKYAFDARLYSEAMSLCLIELYSAKSILFNLLRKLYDADGCAYFGTMVEICIDVSQYITQIHVNSVT